MLPTVSVYNQNGLLALKLSAFSSSVVQVIKGIPSVRWDPPSGAWLVDQAHAQDALNALVNVPTKLADGVARSVRTPYERGEATLPSPQEWDYVPKLKSYNHQTIASSKAFKARIFAFLMEMGTGKTKAAIDTLSALVLKDQIDGALIVCPKCVLFNWEREIEQYSPLDPSRRRCLVVTDENKQLSLELAYNARIQFVITNYETTIKHEKWLLQLLVGQRMAMVLDESTRIKNHAAAQSKACTRLGRAAKARFIMSGTPITQGPLDAFSQFLFLDPNILGHHSFYSFKAEYSKSMAGIVKGKAANAAWTKHAIHSYQNLDRLAKRIAPWSYRVLKSDCLDLPSKIYRTVEIELSPKQRICYDQMKNDNVVECEGLVVACSVVLTKLLRLQQITSGFLPEIDQYGKTIGFKNLGGKKVDMVLELLEEARENKQKVIIWCRFTEELMALATAIGEKVVLYHGATSGEDRQKAVDAFQNSDTVDVFIGQIQTGGMGITLTKATVVIYVSNTFTLSDRLQSEDRAHRIGQTSNVLYVDMVCKGSVDAYVLSCLRDKKDVADMVTGDNMRQLMGKM